MSVIKKTVTGDNFYQKFGTGADETAVSNLQMYQRFIGSDGEGNVTFKMNSPYSQGTNTLQVFVNGQKVEMNAIAALPNQYKEVDSLTIEFGSALENSDVLECMILGVYGFNEGDFDSWFKDHEFLPIEWATDGAVAPDTADFVTVGDTRLVARKFAGDADNDVVFMWRASKRIMPTTTIKFRVVFLVTEATAPDVEGVVFELEAADNLADGVNINENWGDTETSEKLSMAAATYDQYSIAYSEWSADISISDLTANNMMLLKMARLASSDPSDNYAQPVGVVALEIQW
jgi:hypothetical protein